MQKNDSIDIYDFDGTLYRGDSTLDFFKWCLKRYPRLATIIPRIAIAGILCFGMHTASKDNFKASLYRFLTFIPWIEHEVELFWKEHEKKITGPCSPQKGDIVITASPDFLLRGVCEKRGLTILASLVDPHTGILQSHNCSGTEKANRYYAYLKAHNIDPNTIVVENFYSDSRNDDPMARIARSSWMVTKNTLTPWPALKD